MYAFCYNDEEYAVPNTVRIIGSFAFSCTQNLKKIIIPKSAISIEDDVFDECENLVEYIIPKSLSGFNVFKKMNLKKTIREFFTMMYKSIIIKKYTKRYFYDLPEMQSNLR